MRAERANFPIVESFKWDSRALVIGPVLLITIYLVVIPLVFLIWTSFRAGQIGMPAELTFSNYARAYANPTTYELMHNTLVFAFGSAAIALVLGIIFAWLVERTNLPFKDLLYPLFLVPIAIPGVLFSIAWVLLLSPGAGIVNFALKHIFQLDQAPLNVYNLGGMVFLEGLHLHASDFSNDGGVISPHGSLSRRGVGCSRRGIFDHALSNHPAGVAPVDPGRTHLCTDLGDGIFRDPRHHWHAGRYSSFGVQNLSRETGIATRLRHAQHAGHPAARDQRHFDRRL